MYKIKNKLKLCPKVSPKIDHIFQKMAKNQKIEINKVSLITIHTKKYLRNSYKFIHMNNLKHKNVNNKLGLFKILTYACILINFWVSSILRISKYDLYELCDL